MHHQPRAERWSSNDIEVIKFGFLSGIPLKVLAKKVGRTPTALSKALSRFNIREDYIRGLKAPTRNKRSMRTSVDFIIDFLNNHGYSVYKKTFCIGLRHFCEYFVNQQPVALARLIVIANGIRLEEHRPIFFVEGLEVQEGEPYEQTIDRNGLQKRIRAV
jgi:hypothetical protein